jgi:hypothetical protein
LATLIQVQVVIIIAFVAVFSSRTKKIMGEQCTAWKDMIRQCREITGRSVTNVPVIGDVMVANVAQGP